jgi:alkanesulfonate monooxygenase SsuD/methylene tetrahydromethanopterin reductase-like flavin-dependent oxidoreductase (luciferase family)
MVMNYGFVYPGGEARAAAECALAAEAAGWDGFFVWDPVWGVDAWVSLAAAAMRTERIRLGTMITPVSRYRPWQLASGTATLDRLSGGRVILAVGLGAIDTGLIQFGEETDRRTRAELLDEGLEILTGLWRGQPYAFDGRHYHVKETTFLPPPPPVQTPRIPIWVVAAWPWPKSMDRAARYDGLLPLNLSADKQMSPLTPADVAAMRAYLAEHRAATTPFDIVVEGETPGHAGEAALARIRAFGEAGATWWLEAMWGEADAKTLWLPATHERILARIRQGPPRVA